MKKDLTRSTNIGDIICNLITEVYFFPEKTLEPFELQRKDTISWQTFRRCDIQKKLVQREGVNGWKMNFLI